jgi:nucleoid-associated protein YgaU
MKEFIMGLWSFVKDAGSSLFGGKAEAGTVPEADAIKAEVKVDGDKVTLEGRAVSPEMKEKIIVAAGNIKGVAAVQAESDADEPVFYTVKKGDTLSAIAQHTLGKASLYPSIFEANKPMLSHPDKIYPGQMLRIPAKA